MFKCLMLYQIIIATGKGTFYSESAGEMWNRHIKVPKIAPELLFPMWHEL